MAAEAADPRSVLGRETPWVDVVLERQAIERYLMALDQDVEPFSLKSKPERWGGEPIAPAGALTCLRVDADEIGIPDLGKVRLNGGNEYEYLVPIHPGETLQRKTRIVDVVAREGKAGTLWFFTHETTYRRPNGQVVAKARTSTIRG